MQRRSRAHARREQQQQKRERQPEEGSAVPLVQLSLATQSSAMDSGLDTAAERADDDSPSPRSPRHSPTAAREVVSDEDRVARRLSGPSEREQRIQSGQAAQQPQLPAAASSHPAMPAVPHSATPSLPQHAATLAQTRNMPDPEELRGGRLQHRAADNGVATASLSPNSSSSTATTAMNIVSPQHNLMTPETLPRRRRTQSKDRLATESTLLDEVPSLLSAADPLTAATAMTSPLISGRNTVFEEPASSVAPAFSADDLSRTMLRITVHRTDAFRPPSTANRLSVRVRAFDAKSGQSIGVCQSQLAKSLSVPQSARQAPLLSSSSDAMSPLTRAWSQQEQSQLTALVNTDFADTAACSLSATPLVQPKWEETVELQLAYAKPQSTVILLFELIGSLDPASSEAPVPTAGSSQPQAAAFLRLHSLDKLADSPYLGKAVALQLHSPLNTGGAAANDRRPYFGSAWLTRRWRKQQRALQPVDSLERSELPQPSSCAAIWTWYCNHDSGSALPASLLVTVSSCNSSLDNPPAGIAANNDTTASLTDNLAKTPRSALSPHHTSSSLPRWTRAAYEPTQVPTKIKAKLYPSGHGSLAAAFSHQGHILAVSAGKSPLSVTAAGNRSLGPELSAISLYSVTAAGDTGAFELRSQLSSHRGLVYDLAFSPADDYLASASADGSCMVWQLLPVASSTNTTAPAELQGKPMAILSHPTYVYCVRFAQAPPAAAGQGKSLQMVTGGFDGAVRFWALQPQSTRPIQAMWTVMCHAPAAVNALAVDHTGLQLCSVDSTGNLRMWSLPRQPWHAPQVSADDFRPVPRLAQAAAEELRGTAMTSVQFVPSSKRLLLQCKDNVLRILSLNGSTIVQRLVGATFQTGLMRASCSACGTLVAAGSDDGMVLVWSINTGTILHRASFGDRLPVLSAVFHPHDHMLAACGYRTGAPVMIFAGQGSVSSPQGNDLRGGELSRRPEGLPTDSYAAATPSLRQQRAAEILSQASAHVASAESRHRSLQRRDFMFNRSVDGSLRSQTMLASTPNAGHAGRSEVYNTPGTVERSSPSREIGHVRGQSRVSLQQPAQEPSSSSDEAAANVIQQTLLSSVAGTDDMIVPTPDRGDRSAFSTPNRPRRSRAGRRSQRLASSASPGSSVVKLTLRRAPGDSDGDD